MEIAPVVRPLWDTETVAPQVQLCCVDHATPALQIGLWESWKTPPLTHQNFAKSPPLDWTYHTPHTHPTFLQHTPHITCTQHLTSHTLPVLRNHQCPRPSQCTTRRYIHTPHSPNKINNHPWCNHHVPSSLSPHTSPIYPPSATVRNTYVHSSAQFLNECCVYSNNCKALLSCKEPCWC